MTRGRPSSLAADATPTSAGLLLDAVVRLEDVYDLVSKTTEVGGGSVGLVVAAGVIRAVLGAWLDGNTTATLVFSRVVHAIVAAYLGRVDCVDTTATFDPLQTTTAR